MSALPKGWEVLKLGEVVQHKKGKKPKILAETQEPHFLPYVDIKAFEKNIIQKYAHESDGVLAHPEDTLMVWDGARSGLVGKGVKGLIGSTLSRLTPKLDGINRDYLHHFFVNQFNYINGNTKGTGIPHVDPAKLWDLDFPLPSLANQKRIADKLDSVLTKVDAVQARLDKIPTLLKRFRQSVLAAATSGELTKEWREENVFPKWDIEELTNAIYQRWLSERENEFRRKGKAPKTNTWMKKFPPIKPYNIVGNDWIELSLENIAEIVDPNPSHRMPKYVADGSPFISSENIVSIEKLNFKKGKRVTEEEVEKQKARYEIKKGTFAFTRIGSIGKSVLLPTPHNYGISHAMAVVNPYDEIVNSSYLIWVMNCESTLKQAMHGVQSVGVPDLGIGKMKAFKIPIPSMSEQKEIVSKIEAFFEHANTVEKQYQAAKNRLDKLTQSILAKAFRGELVTADDCDIEQVVSQVEGAL